MCRYPSVPGYKNLTRSYFESEQGPVDINPQMVHDSNIYIAHGYDGKDLTEELHSMVSMVFHNDTKECKKDWENHFGCGKVFKFLEKEFKKPKRKGNRKSKYPDEFKLKNHLKPNFKFRILFSNKHPIEEGLFVFEVDWNKYCCEFSKSVELLLQDCEEAGWDWYEIPIQKIEEASYHVKIGHESDAKCEYQWLDFPQSQWDPMVKEFNKQFNKDKRVNRSTTVVSRTPNRNKNKNKARKNVKNKSKTDVTGKKRSLSRMRSDNRDNNNDRIENESDDSDKPVEKEARQHSPTQPNLLLPPLEEEESEEEKSKSKNKKKKNDKKLVTRKGVATRGRGRARGGGRGGVSAGNKLHTHSATARRTGLRTKKGKGNSKDTKKDKRIDSLNDDETTSDTNDESNQSSSEENDSNNSQSKSNDSQSNTDDSPSNNNESKTEINESEAQNNDSEISDGSVDEHESSESKNSEISDAEINVTTTRKTDDESTISDNEEIGKSSGKSRDLTKMSATDPMVTDDENENENGSSNNDNDNNINEDDININESTGQVLSNATSENIENTNNNDLDLSALENLGRDEAAAAVAKKTKEQNKKPTKKANSKNKTSKDPPILQQEQSEYEKSSDEDESDLDYTNGYDISNAEEIDLEWITKEEYVNVEEVQALTVFYVPSGFGVEKDSYLRGSKTSLYGHRSGNACLIAKGEKFDDALNDKTFTIKLADLKLKMKLCDNCVTNTKFYLQVKRNVHFAFGAAKSDDDNLSNYIHFNSDQLNKYYSYFNVPAFGFKTSNQETAGTKNLRLPTYLIGPVWVWILAKYGGKHKRTDIRRVAREVFIRNGRWDAKIGTIKYQIRKWQVTDSVHKQFVKLIFCVLAQARCGIINLVNSGCINYNSGRVDFTDWPIVPNIVDPIMAQFRLATRIKNR